MKQTYQKHLKILSQCLVTVLFGCSFHMATIPLISMTRSENPTKTKSIGPVTQKYCTDENPTVITDDGESARIDEVIKRAQIAFKADYLRNASLTLHGLNRHCIIVEAEGLRIH